MGFLYLLCKPQVLNDSPYLGASESSVLAPTMRQSGRWAILADRAARTCARELHVRTLGTVGLIVLAKRRGLTRSARDAITKVSDAGCWLSAEVARADHIESAEG